MATFSEKTLPASPISIASIISSTGQQGVVLGMARGDGLCGLQCQAEVLPSLAVQGMASPCAPAPLRICARRRSFPQFRWWKIIRLSDIKVFLLWPKFYTAVEKICFAKLLDSKNIFV